MLANSIIYLIKKIEVYKGFESLSGEDYCKILLDLGKADYRAAIRAFEDAKESSDPIREIQMGLTCLRLSQEKFKLGAGDGNILNNLAIILMRAITLNAIGGIARLDNKEKFIEVSLVLAFYYNKLNEKKLSEKYIQEAKEMFVHFRYNYIERWTTGANGSTMDRTNQEARSEMEQTEKLMNDYIKVLV